MTTQLPQKTKTVVELVSPICIPILHLCEFIYMYRIVYQNVIWSPTIRVRVEDEEVE